MNAPKTLIQSLKGALCRQLQCDSSVLVEEDPGSTSGETKLTEINNGVILRLARPGAGGDPNAWLFPLLNADQKGLTKTCDYAICLPRDKSKRLVVLLCELKSRNPGDHLKQLRGGLLLLEYALNAALLALPPTRLPDLIEYRGVTFSTTANISPRGPSKPSKHTDFHIDPKTGLPFMLARAGRTFHVNEFCSDLPPDRRRPHRHFSASA